MSYLPQFIWFKGLLNGSNSFKESPFFIVTYFKRLGDELATNNVDNDLISPTSVKYPIEFTGSQDILYISGLFENALS